MKESRASTFLMIRLPPGLHRLAGTTRLRSPQSSAQLRGE
jgi:hypothetical protein